MAITTIIGGKTQPRQVGLLMHASDSDTILSRGRIAQDAVH